MSDPAARRIHLMSGLIMLGTFLAGAVAGAGVYGAMRPGRGPGGPFGGPPGMRGGPRYLDELELSKEQREQAKAIFDKHHQQVEAILSESFPRVRAANDAMDEELKKILTPEQVTKLEELKKRRLPHRPGDRHGGPPGFGPPPGGPGGPGGPPPFDDRGPPPGEPPPAKPD